MIPWWRPFACWLGLHCHDCERRFKRCCCACHKRLWWAAVAALLLIPSGASAKPFYKRWTWWAGWAGIAAANYADLASTARVQYVCAGCQEENIFSPGRTHLVRIGIINGVAETGLDILFPHIARKWHLGPRWETGSDFMWPVASGIEHGWAANHNYNLANQVYANHVAQDIPLPGGQAPWRH